MSRAVFRPLKTVETNGSTSRNDGRDRPWTVGLNVISSLDVALIQGRTGTLQGAAVSDLL